MSNPSANRVFLINHQEGHDISQLEKAMKEELHFYGYSRLRDRLVVVNYTNLPGAYYVENQRTWIKEFAREFRIDHLDIQTIHSKIPGSAVHQKEDLKIPVYTPWSRSLLVDIPLKIIQTPGGILHKESYLSMFELLFGNISYNFMYCPLNAENAVTQCGIVSFTKGMESAQSAKVQSLSSGDGTIYQAVKPLTQKTFIELPIDSRPIIGAPPDSLAVFYNDVSGIVSRTMPGSINLAAYNQIDALHDPPRYVRTNVEIPSEAILQAVRFYNI